MSLVNDAKKERRKIDTESLKKIRPYGQALADIIKRDNPTGNKVCLAFSLGKDAVASWLWLREYGFEVIPIHRFGGAPDLSFVDDAIAYYQDFFKTKIWSVPHSFFYQQLRNYVFQPPQRLDAIDELNIPEFDHEDQRIELLEYLDEDTDMWLANGVRAADAMNRRINILVTGPINYKTRVFLPIWDYSHDDLEKSFDKHGVKLPFDYRMWGRSFDGVCYDFGEAMRKMAPSDYEKLKTWFPLIEADRKRYEYAQARRRQQEKQPPRKTIKAADG